MIYLVDFNNDLCEFELNYEVDPPLFFSPLVSWLVCHNKNVQQDGSYDADEVEVWGNGHEKGYRIYAIVMKNNILFSQKSHEKS